MESAMREKNLMELREKMIMEAAARKDEGKCE